MPEQPRDLRPHFVLSGTSDTQRYTRPRLSVTPPTLPELDRDRHGRALLEQVTALKTVADTAKKRQEDAGLDTGYGLQIQFKSLPNVELAFERLARERSGIELLNVQHHNDVTYANVYVPDGKLDVFEKLVQDYLTEKKDKRGHLRDNKSLINTIQEIRAATFDALWTDDTAALPQSDSERIWWEVWLPVRDDRSSVVSRFRNLAEQIGFHLSRDELQFPERTVLLMQGTMGQIKQSVLLLNSIAELRRAKETAEFFDSMTPVEQREWVEDLLARTQYPDGRAPHICILDTGVNRGHPLIQPALDSGDLHTIEPDWGSSDDHGHGTEMAGLALVGDLSEALTSKDSVALSHRLESVKLLRNDHDNEGRHYGHLTAEAVSRPEIHSPQRRRVYSMAVTAKDGRDRGRPSAWSSTIDRLACDYDNEGLNPRLLIISAGNVKDNHAWMDYPNSNASDGVHDPGQAWNALTIGAYTEKTRITESDAGGYQPVAQAGSLSPFSTTSLTWEKSWPLKPDVVMEGGNVAKDAIGAVTMHSLGLLTTNFRPAERLLTTSNATSAAAALCARMAAQLIARYPQLWPETTRALIVHSAEWTAKMREAFLDPNERAKDYANLIKHCGFGVPNLERAMWSVSNSLTLIAQDELQPFERESGAEPRTRDMHLHRLPWPKDALQDLGEIEVEMRVTLSYFIEPNPGVAERGIKGRYRYESHGLRFEVKRPAETVTSFRARINQRVRDEEEGSYSGGGSDTGWRLGPNLRHLGSIHSDIWVGKAADLAERGVLAIFPAMGWWKTLKKLERHNRKARYALIVSIRAPKVDIDLYNVVRNMVTAQVPIAT